MDPPLCRPLASNYCLINGLLVITRGHFGSSQNGHENAALALQLWGARALASVPWPPTPILRYLLIIVLLLGAPWHVAVSYAKLVEYLRVLRTCSRTSFQRSVGMSDRHRLLLCVATLSRSVV